MHWFFRTGPVILYVKQGTVAEFVKRITNHRKHSAAIGRNQTVSNHRDLRTAGLIYMKTMKNMKFKFKNPFMDLHEIFMYFMLKNLIQKTRNSGLVAQRGHWPQPNDIKG